MKRYLVKYSNRLAWSNEFSADQVDSFVVSKGYIRDLADDWDVEVAELMDQVMELEDGAVYLASYDWVSKSIAASVNAGKDALLYAIGIDVGSRDDLESAYFHYPFVDVDDVGNYYVDYDHLYII